jgi:internalin A
MLELSKTPVDRLDAIADLPLTNLDLTNTNVTDLRPLARMHTLEQLKIDRTGIADIEPLLGLANLRQVFVSRTAIPRAAIDRLELAIESRTFGPSRSRLAIVGGPIVW